jgi:uncharacterized membrane protein YjgN (DUF898 family)
MPKKNIKKLIIGMTLFAVLAIFNPVLAQSYNFADDSGLNKAGDAAGYDSFLQKLTPETLGGRIIAQILTLLGVIFIAAMLYGGITWMTAGGSEQRVEKAKHTITAGIIGLVVVLAAYAASYFVINYFSGPAIN